MSVKVKQMGVATPRSYLKLQLHIKHFVTDIYKNYTVTSPNICCLQNFLIIDLLVLVRPIKVVSLCEEAYFAGLHIIT